MKMLKKEILSLLARSSIPAKGVKKHLPLTVPCCQVGPGHWPLAVETFKKDGARFAALWGCENRREEGPSFSLYAAFFHPEKKYFLCRTKLSGNNLAVDSIARLYPVALRMERSISDFFGVTFRHSPDHRHWLKHEHWPENAHPLLASFNGRKPMPRTEGKYHFLEAEGEGGYEIPVGPVHAGIIEPGHFRFYAVGEKILHMEARLGYVHKGIEKRIEGMTAEEAMPLASRVSGDTTVACAWAFADACEKASAFVPPERAVFLRAILCERERMANHIGDIGAICNDAAFILPHVRMQRIREDLARLHKKLFGHRLMMNTIVPGGVVCDLTAEGAEELLEMTRKAAEEVGDLRMIHEDYPSILDRVQGSGRVDTERARELGLLGYCGRASSVESDVRVWGTYSPYDRFPVEEVAEKSCDVAARLQVRFREIAASARLIERLLRNLPAGEIRDEWTPPEMGATGFSAIEAWRGELLCWVRFGDGGRIDRFVIRDPSEINWLGLELAVRKVPVPDFPLNNKSFNCSYSGNDK